MFGCSMLDPLLTDLCVDVVDLEEDVDAAAEWAEEMGLTLVANVNLTDIVAAIDRKSLTFSIVFWLFFTIHTSFKICLWISVSGHYNVNSVLLVLFHIHISAA